MPCLVMSYERLQSVHPKQGHRDAVEAWFCAWVPHCTITDVFSVVQYSTPSSVESLLLIVKVMRRCGGFFYLVFIL